MCNRKIKKVKVSSLIKAAIIGKPLPRLRKKDGTNKPYYI